MLDPDPAGSKALGSGLVPDPAESKNSASGAPYIQHKVTPSQVALTIINIHKK